LNDAHSEQREGTSEAWGGGGRHTKIQKGESKSARSQRWNLGQKKKGMSSRKYPSEGSKKGTKYLVCGGRIRMGEAWLAIGAKEKTSRIRKEGEKTLSPD